METEFLKWSNKYSVDIQEIDDQHKKLFVIINDLNTASMKNLVTEEIDAVIQKLIEYSDYHFTTEENYFDSYRYEKAVEHKASHQQFIDKLQDIYRLNSGLR